MPRTRFAPSPTGYLHLGHAYSALFASRAAQGSDFLLRIENIDPVRCKAELTEAIIEDLNWLGLKWPKPIRKQSEHFADYASALDVLKQKNLLYPCFCTRREIEQEARLAVGAPHADDSITIYPGTCRHLSVSQRAEKLAQNVNVSWRLDVTEASRQTGALFWRDESKGHIEAQPDLFGDVVLARKDVPVSYHLCVTVDDHLQGIELVTRGEDLFSSTHIHRLLQALLGYEVPHYYHHKLIGDEQGRRYAKRDQSVTLRSLRADGINIDQIIQGWFIL